MEAKKFPPVGGHPSAVVFGERKVKPILFVVALCLLALMIPGLAIAPRAYATICTQAPNNLTTNGSMLGPGHATPYGAVADAWNPFVLSATTPNFEWVDYNANGDTGGGGSQYIWADLDAFDAGIYQTITGLTPGVYYHFALGFAQAAFDLDGQGNARNNLIGRQVGVDRTGGTNPSSPNVTWGNVYWDGIAALNIPDLSMTFVAQANQATIFLRVVNTNVNNGRSKVWFDVVCMRALDPQPSPHALYLPIILAGASACAPTTLATIPVGTHPKGVAADPVTNQVYVSLFDSSSVAVIAAASNQKIAEWSTSSAGHANGIGVTSGRVFVALRDASSVAILNAATGALIATPAVGSLPYGVSAVNGKVWVANFGSNSVSVLDAASATVIATPSGGGNPALAAPATSRAYVTYFGGGVLEVSDTGSVARDFTTTGVGSYGVAYNSAANLIYISNRNNSQVAALASATGASVKSVTLTQVPYGLAYNPGTNHLFVVLAEANQLAVLDGTTLHTLAVVSLGTQGDDGGDGIAVMNNRVYVANNAAGTVSVISDPCGVASPRR
ncbi:MAG: YncE family protein [Chloroflexi bacterium]|nr:YncE family protein [Chloroflexota bacterium]